MYHAESTNVNTCRKKVGHDLVFNGAGEKARKYPASTSSTAGLTPNTAGGWRNSQASAPAIVLLVTNLHACRLLVAHIKQCFVLSTNGTECNGANPLPITATQLEYNTTFDNVKSRLKILVDKDQLFCYGLPRCCATKHINASPSGFRVCVR